MDILREFSSEGLYMRYAVDELPDDGDFIMHVHEQCEIYYFVSGNAEYLVEGSRYPLEAGSILIMRPAESHRVKIISREKYERYAVNFSVSLIDIIDPRHLLLNAFFDRPLGRGNLYLPEEFETENIHGLFAEMCGESGCPKSDYEKRLNILTGLFSLLGLINKIFTNRRVSDYLPPQSASEKIVSYVNAHLFDKLSVPMLAEHFFLSASQFSRIFKQATGAAPWEYITIKRLTAAREKIRGGISVRNAAESCGFGDHSAFYRAYVKHFGCAPSSEGK